MPKWSSNDIRGFTVPVPTPFNLDGSVDEQCLRGLIDLYIETRVDALFFLGSFGNGPALRPEERMRVVEVALEHLNGRLPSLVHVGCVDPQTSALLGVHAREHQADAIAIVGPYYYSDRNDWELTEHIRMVDQAVGLPILIYNNVEYSGYDITPQLLDRFREAAPRIFGSKLASGTVQKAKRYIQALKPPFSAFIPADNFPDALIEDVPLAGTINPPLAAWPELGVDLTKVFLAGDLLKTVELHKQSLAYYALLGQFRVQHGRGVTCEVFKARGVPMQKYPRWPTLPFTEEERQQLRSGLEKVGFPVRASAAVA